MNKELQISDIAKREKNFYNGPKDLPSTEEKINFYSELQLRVDALNNQLCELPQPDKKFLLRLIFDNIYRFVIEGDNFYNIFYGFQDIHREISEDAFFLSLCFFLYDSKRIDAASLGKFVYTHSPLRISDPKSSFYLENYKDRDNQEFRPVTAEETNLRQYRHRFFANRSGHGDDKEWSAIRQPSEHEWTLYFELETAEEKIQDTAKRIRTLYNDLYKAINSSQDSEYPDKLQKAYDKFQSKLKKIKYEHFLGLTEYFLDHIKKDEEYYGINLYRLEKTMSPYKITDEVNSLCNCNVDGIDDFLTESAALKDIPFPKLRKHIVNSGSFYYLHDFWSCMKDVICSTRLVYDQFIDEGFFGDDWEKLFRECINEMAENVLFDPTKINYSVTEDSQEVFHLYLSAFAHMLVDQARQRNLTDQSPQKKITE